MFKTLILWILITKIIYKSIYIVTLIMLPCIIHKADWPKVVNYREKKKYSTRERGERKSKHLLREDFGGGAVLNSSQTPHLLAINKHMRWTILSLFYRWGNQDSEKFSNLPKEWGSDSNSYQFAFNTIIITLPPTKKLPK